jgi:hypothetical protein
MCDRQAHEGPASQFKDRRTRCPWLLAVRVMAKPVGSTLEFAVPGALSPDSVNASSELLPSTVVGDADSPEPSTRVLLVVSLDHPTGVLEPFMLGSLRVSWVGPGTTVENAWLGSERNVSSMGSAGIVAFAGVGGKW